MEKPPEYINLFFLRSLSLSREQMSSRVRILSEDIGEHVLLCQPRRRTPFFFLCDDGNIIIENAAECIKDKDGW